MAKEENSKAKASGEDAGNALAARRARLRGSLAKQAQSTDVQPAALSTEAANKADLQVSLNSTSFDIEEVHENNSAIELLGHIDQALNSCAGYLASLQKVAGKQIDELKLIADTLQNRTFSDVGLNINTLMESLAAAVEPMKAIGELVPALDRLVSINESKDKLAVKGQISDKQLITNLAEQLVAGVIDPWTFKCAYQAIFPDYDPSDLAHQLGELVGEQELSGELFQVAYQALQSAQTPVAPANFSPIFIGQAAEQAENDNLVYDTDNDLTAPGSERESELEKLLADKEQELEEIKTQLDMRWQEMSHECEELRSALENRENILREKEADLNEKINELSARNSENQQLRAQMEELRDQTKNMVADLQKQLTQKQAEEKAIRAAKAKTVSPQPGFFDLISSSAPSGSLLDSTAAAPRLFANGEHEQNYAQSLSGNSQSQLNARQPTPEDGINPGADSTNAARKQVQAGGVTRSASIAQTAPGILSGGMETNVITTPPNTANTAPSGFTSPTASFVTTTGSYGSGVRAQVFEVIVRQALAGAHWREICAVPMQINNIAPEEVETEVKRRQTLLKK